jgi:hypothetical protein
MLPSLDPSDAALFRSGSGDKAGFWLQALPTSAATKMEAAVFQVALRRRLRIPLPMLPSTCNQSSGHGCRSRIDIYGDHLAACPRTGLLARRANPMERAWIRVLREAGARVVPKQLLRDTNVPISNPLDQRQLDLVAYGITPQGVPLCCDSTMVSPIQSNGRAIPRAAASDGVALERALRRKRATYAELVDSAYGQLVVLACEVGGRWSEDCLRLVRTAAKYRSRGAPHLLRTSARAAWQNRWWSILSVAAQSSLANTLLGNAPAMQCPSGWESPMLLDAWEHDSPMPAASRVPLRA